MEKKIVKTPSKENIKKQRASLVRYWGKKQMILENNILPSDFDISDDYPFDDQNDWFHCP